MCLIFVRYYSTFIVQYLTMSMKYLLLCNLREGLLRESLCNELHDTSCQYATCIKMYYIYNVRTIAW
jgi:hypothetical protein